LQQVDPACAASDHAAACGSNALLWPSFRVVHEQHEQVALVTSADAHLVIKVRHRQLTWQQRQQQQQQQQQRQQQPMSAATYVSP
jgi:hypothetical protein